MACGHPQGMKRGLRSRAALLSRGGVRLALKRRSLAKCRRSAPKFLC